MVSLRIYPSNPAISVEPITSFFGPVTSSPPELPRSKDVESSFLCDLSKKAQLFRIPSLSRQDTKVFSPPSYLFIAPPSHAISLSGHQALPPSYLKISSVSVSEARPTVDWLTSNASDALFAICDAPTLTPISPIVSAPDADSNESTCALNRSSGPYISPSTFRERPRPFTSFLQFPRHLSAFADILYLIPPSSSQWGIGVVFENKKQVVRTRMVTYISAGWGNSIRQPSERGP
jgi:hypothetical protein